MSGRSPFAPEGRPLSASHGSALEPYWVCLGTPNRNVVTMVVAASLAVKADPRGGEATA